MKTSWKTQINILWFGQAVLMAMLAMSLPYWPLYVAELGDFSPVEIRYWSAAIYLAPFISSTFSSPFWGRLGDKHGYKPMVIRACIGLVITQALILFVSNVALIFCIRFLQGLIAGFIAAAQAWALDMSPVESRGLVIGKLQAATAIGNLLGPLAGGVIATFGGYQAIFTVSTYIAIIITLLFFFCLKATPIAKEKSTQEAVPLSWRAFFNFRDMVSSLLIVIILIQLARAVVTPIFALFVTEKLGGNDITIGILYAATGLMIFISAPLWGNYFDRLIKAGHKVTAMIIFLLLFSASLQVIHAYTENATVVFILRLLWGVTLGALLPVLTRLLVDNALEHERGLMLGLGNSANKFGNLVGILLGALVEAHFGYTSSFLMNAALYIGAVGIILLHIKPVTQKVKEL